MLDVRIVTRDADADNILGRLIRSLQEGTNWSASSNPDPNADVNLYFPYLEITRHPNFHSTPLAAWFSHRDVGRDEKVTVFDNAAKQVQLRTASCAIYVEYLAHAGETAYVHPPLDTNFFQIGKQRKRARERPLIGTSGFVYPGGRKGEHLLSKLAVSSMRADFIASGTGWPVNTIKYEWAKMPAFLQNLDVYVCTSGIEGIGYGPMESLACGIPTVVPQSVGIFDEIPDAHGLYRYEANNYDSLNAALTNAVEYGGDPEELRASVTQFTQARWVSSHVEAFKRFDLQVESIPSRLPKAKGRCGVFYVAYGKQARDCAQRAMVSFRDHMKDVPIALVSDKSIGLEDVFIEHPDSDIGARSVKTKIYDLAPQEWQFVLYLDADTEVTADISFLFKLLEDGWEWVMCINPAQYVLAREMKRPDNVEEFTETINFLGTDEILQLNGGVFAFRRNKRTEKLLRSWHAEWDRYGKRDQAAFDRALYANPVRLYTLGVEFNTVTRYYPPERTAGILHHPLTARRWRGVINGRLDSSEAWASLHPDREEQSKPKNRKRLADE